MNAEIIQKAPSVLMWMGSKGHQMKNLTPILDQIPRFLYVEPFGGSGAVFLKKRPEKGEVYNDLNSLLVNFFRVLRSEEKTEMLVKLSKVYPMSREFWHEAKRICLAFFNKDEELLQKLIECANLNNFPKDVVVAWLFFYCQNTGFGGIFLKSFGGGERETTPNIFYHIEQNVRGYMNFRIDSQKF